MSAVPVTMVGTLTTGDKVEQATFVGLASLTGLGVGGGPIVPDKPPGIWGGPIDPYPGHPLPEPPGPKPPDPTEPPVKWKTVWTPTEGWVVVGIITPSGDHVVPSAGESRRK